MTDKYADLRAALDAGPTPGPWKANTSNEIGPISKEDDQSFGMILPVCFAEFENSEANRRYIAAANPETIRALLADYDRLREALSFAEPELVMLSTELERINRERPDLVAVLPSLNVLSVVRAALAQEQP